MRILLVTPFYQPAWAYGGMARATTGLAREVAKRGHQVVVATIRWEADQPEEEDADGVLVRRFESPRWLRERLVPWPHGFSRWLRSEPTRFDVAHLAGHRNGLAVVASHHLGRSRVPFVLQPHGTFPHHGTRRVAKRIFDRLFGKAVADRAAALVAVSRAEADELPRPAVVVPNGVDRVGEIADADRVSAGDGPGLLFVGSDAPQKRGHLMPALLRALPETRLTMVGRIGQRLRRQLAPFGDRVVFPGVLGGDGLASAYAAADLLVHPAVGEAFGLAPFEASLYGTAAVVAGGHGCGEWFARAGGCVVPPADVSAFIDAVRRRLDAPETAEREARSVSVFVGRDLTWPLAASAIESVYRSVIDRGARHG